ncbi:Bug family tripartite tricarboxylate transporter substrate binding protein [Polaromonas sp.]|uniref:Bug family tripartite tricarboxylate transporter substrate binding protein n=1 Tax=Polaromonas sp. TaxID=1869339 RepID=UPI00352B18E4
MFKFFVALVMLGTFAVNPLMAQTYPSKPIRMVVTYAPGGITDSLARAVAAKMSDSMGQQVIVDNRVGGSGNIGSAMVAKAAPDGYTILFGANGPQAANVSLFAKLPYDPVKDLTPVALVGISGVVLVVAQTAPYNNLQELISAAKAKPGTLTFGSSGAGGTPHLAGESLKTSAGLDMIHVPYKGDAPSVVDVIGGQVTMAFPGTGSAVALVRGGKLKALAVSSSRRSEALPSVPTFAETLPGFELVGWFGIFLPAGAPSEILATLHREALKAVNDPKIKEQFLKLGVDVPEPPLSPMQFKDFQLRDIARLGSVIQHAKVKLD